MNTLNFLDANVWMALLWSRHIHSATAKAWFEEASDERFLYCRFTQVAVLRLLATENLMGLDTKTMPEAWNVWDRVCADDRIAFLPEPAGIEREFRSRSRLSSRSPKVWADAYILAFAKVAGLKLITFDRALKPQGDFVFVL
jgi:toxin-antitoxin system PIN domain toxin